MREEKNGYAFLKGKWRSVEVVALYDYKYARRVRYCGEEWIVDVEKFSTLSQFAEKLRQEFESKNAALVSAFRSSKQPIKAKIAREIGIAPSTLCYRLKKAAELGVDLSYRGHAPELKQEEI